MPQQSQMCHDQLSKMQIKKNKKKYMLSLSSFPFCETKKPNVTSASQF